METAEFLKRVRKRINIALAATGRTGNVLVLQRLLDAVVHVHAPQGLASAAAGKRLEAMNKSIQDHLLDITLALPSAGSEGNVDIIEHLLCAGADATQVDIRRAAAGGFLDVLTCVLRSGARADFTRFDHDYDYGDQTALQLAAEKGHLPVVDLPVVELLIASGADVNAPATRHKGTAVQLAFAGGHMAVTKRLMTEGADMNTPPSRRFAHAALQAAAREGNTPLSEELLLAGAGISTADEDTDMQGLWLAAGMGMTSADTVDANKPEVVSRLLSMIPPADVPRTTSATLRKAVENHESGFVRQLLQRRPGVDLHESSQATMLQVAAANVDLESLKLLVAAGADVNLNPRGAWGQYQNTALQSAAEQGNLDAVKLLLDAGAESTRRGRWRRRCCWRLDTAMYKSLIIF